MDEVKIVRAIKARRAYDVTRTMAAEWLIAESELNEPEFLDYQERYARGEL